MGTVADKVIPPVAKTIKKAWEHHWLKFVFWQSHDFFIFAEYLENKVREHFGKKFEVVPQQDKDFTLRFRVLAYKTFKDADKGEKGKIIWEKLKGRRIVKFKQFKDVIVPGILMDLQKWSGEDVTKGNITAKVFPDDVKLEVKPKKLEGVDSEKTAIKAQASKLWDDLSKKGEESWSDFNWLL